MFLVYIWLYTLFLVIVWWFFIVIKIHAFKFKNFSNYITKVISWALILLTILSILWYLIIFLYNPWNFSYKVDISNSSVEHVEY